MTEEGLAPRLTFSCAAVGGARDPGGTDCWGMLGLGGGSTFSLPAAVCDDVAQHEIDLFAVEARGLDGENAGTERSIQEFAERTRAEWRRSCAARPMTVQRDAFICFAEAQTPADASRCGALTPPSR